MLLVEMSLNAALVTVVASGGDRSDPSGSGASCTTTGPTPSRRLRRLLRLAMRDAASFPRWVPGYSIVVAAALAILLRDGVGLPDTATLPANLLFGVWFAATSVGLGRVATRGSVQRIAVTPV